MIWNPLDWVRWLLAPTQLYVTWDTSYEAAPANTDSPSGNATGAAAMIRSTRQAVGVALDHETHWDDQGDSDRGWLRNGAGKIYYQTATPTTRPDGVTALTAADGGRLWMSNIGSRLYVYDSNTTAFASATGLVAQTLYDQGSQGFEVRSVYFSIGSWNMDDPSGGGGAADGMHTFSVSGWSSIASNIVAAQGIIRSDLPKSWAPLLQFTNSATGSTAAAGGFFDIASSSVEADALKITLFRRNGGGFDNTNHNSTGFNRGWVKLEYYV